MDKEKLKRDLECKRRELEDVISKNGREITTGDILNISMQLDELIIRFLKLVESEEREESACIEDMVVHKKSMW